MQELPLDNYKCARFNDIQKLENDIISSKELKFVLKRNWFERVKKVVNDFDERLSIADGAYDLFTRFLYDIQVESFDKRLATVAALAKNQRRQKYYRKTRGELASVQTNQILGSLFELNILYGIIASCPNTDLFPKTGVGGSDVEARITIDDRPIYIEAKALGYSKHDPSPPYSGYVGCHPVKCMDRQIYDALDEKLADAKQLHELSNNGPTVLFLSFGFNADIDYGPLVIDSYFEECRSNVSSIIVFGSALCRGEMKAFPNNFSSFPLSQTERLYFEKDFFNKSSANEIA